MTNQTRIGVGSNVRIKGYYKNMRADLDYQVIDIVDGHFIIKNEDQKIQHMVTRDKLIVRVRKAA